MIGCFLRLEYIYKKMTVRGTGNTKPLPGSQKNTWLLDFRTQVLRLMESMTYHSSSGWWYFFEIILHTKHNKLCSLLSWISLLEHNHNFANDVINLVNVPIFVFLLFVVWYFFLFFIFFTPPACFLIFKTIVVIKGRVISYNELRNRAVKKYHLM